MKRNKYNNTAVRIKQVAIPHARHKGLQQEYGAGSWNNNKSFAGCFLPLPGLPAREAGL